MKKVGMLIGFIALLSVVGFTLIQSIDTFQTSNELQNDVLIEDNIYDNYEHQSTEFDFEFSTKLPIGEDILYIFLEYNNDNENRDELIENCIAFIVENELQNYNVGHSRYVPLVFVSLEGLSDSDISSLESRLRETDGVIDVVVEEYQGFITH